MVGNRMGSGLRRGVLGLILGIGLAVPAMAQDQVKVGLLRIGNPIVIGIEKGFFKEHGVDVEAVYVRSGAEQIPALSTGTVDAVLTSATAALFNAMVAGIDMTIAGDYISLLPDNPSNALIVRSDLADSGEVKSAADLKGRTVGITAMGVYTHQAAVRILEDAGLSVDDVRLVTMPYPDMVAALSNGAIDAANMTEPFVTIAMENGTGKMLVDHSQVMPNLELGVTLLGERLAKDDKDLGIRFMKGLVQSMRYMRGMLTDPARKDEIATLMQRDLPSKDPEMYKRMAWPLTAEGQKVNVASLVDQMEFYTRMGLVKGTPDVQAFVDSSFLEAVDAN